MKQTDNFKLNLPELSDKISPTAFNENTVRIDEMLAKGVRMACGTYTGTGAATCSISTPGFTPMAVLMTTRKTAGECSIASNQGGQYLMAEEAALSSQGWSVWVGQDLPAKRYVSGTLEVDPTYTTYTEYDTTLQFTVVAGGVSWKLASTGNTNTAAAVNNVSGTVYQWIAFGLPSEL